MTGSLAEENARLRLEIATVRAAETAAESERDALAAAMRWLQFDSGSCRTIDCRLPATHRCRSSHRNYCWSCAEAYQSVSCGEYDVILDALPHLVALRSALDAPIDRP